MPTAIPAVNRPFWSLGFEVWYYVAFGTFLFTPRPWRWVATFAVLAFIGPKVMMFPAWLMGVLVYRTCAKRKLPQFAVVLFAVPLGLFAVYQSLPHSSLQQFTSVSLDAERLRSIGQDYFISIMFSAALNRLFKCFRYIRSLARTACSVHPVDYRRDFFPLPSTYAHYETVGGGFAVAEIVAMDIVPAGCDHPCGLSRVRRDFRTS